MSPSNQPAMYLFFDSFWRAVAYCARPRLMLLSLVPLAVASAATLTLAYFFWESGIAAMQAWLTRQALLDQVLRWMNTWGGGGLHMVVAPLLVVICTLPLIITTTLLLVTWLMTPVIVSLVAQRRFGALERLHGGSWWKSLVWGSTSALIALMCLVVTSPLWLVPPLVMLLPPAIWGWLTYRVMVYDVLAQHASHDERVAIVRGNRGSLLLMGTIAGFMGTAPTLVLGTGISAVIMFPLLAPAGIWIFTLVFAFTALWFAHFCLAALQILRAQRATPSAIPGDVEAASAPALLP